jgi:hypothetical protein
MMTRWPPVITATHRTVRAKVAMQTAEVKRQAKRAAALLTRLSADTEWPGGRKPAPPQSLIIPQRGHDAETWESVKLGRKVAFESRTELSLLRALDMAPQVEWFCEQPAAIGYIFAGGTAPTIPTRWRPPRTGTASSSKLSLCLTCHWRSTRRKLLPRELSVPATAGGSWSQTFAEPEGPPDEPGSRGSLAAIC